VVVRNPSPLVVARSPAVVDWVRCQLCKGRWPVRRVVAVLLWEALLLVLLWVALLAWAVLLLGVCLLLE